MTAARSVSSHLSIARGDSAEMSAFIEETLDGSALPVKPAADGRRIDAPGPGPDVSPGSTFGEPLAEGTETK